MFRLSGGSATAVASAAANKGAPDPPPTRRSPLWSATDLGGRCSRRGRRGGDDDFEADFCSPISPSTRRELRRRCGGREICTGSMVAGAGALLEGRQWRRSRKGSCSGAGRAVTPTSAGAQVAQHRECGRRQVFLALLPRCVRVNGAAEMGFSGAPGYSPADMPQSRELCFRWRRASSSVRKAVLAMMCCWIQVRWCSAARRRTKASFSSEDPVYSFVTLFSVGVSLQLCWASCPFWMSLASFRVCVCPVYTCTALC